MQLWYNLPLSSFPISLIFLHSCFLHVCASLSHYSISWRCCVWCVWWSSCSLPLRPINRSLSRVAVVFCIWIAGRALWWLLGRLLCLSIQNWWDSLIFPCQTDFLSDRLSPFAFISPITPFPHIHTLQSCDHWTVKVLSIKLLIFSHNLGVIPSRVCYLWKKQVDVMTPESCAFHPVLQLVKATVEELSVLIRSCRFKTASLPTVLLWCCIRSGDEGAVT